MYRRILVPIDGSSTARLGLEHALRLARDQDALVRVLNVLDDTYMLPAIDAYPLSDIGFRLEAGKAAGEKMLAEAVGLAREQHVSAEKVMLECKGRPVSDVILAHARAWGADIIVMGTHGRRGFNRLLLGSDAERVLRETKVPLLLVRGETVKRRSTTKRAAKSRKRSTSRRSGTETIAVVA